MSFSKCHCGLAKLHYQKCNCKNYFNHSFHVSKEPGMICKCYYNSCNYCFAVIQNHSDILIIIVELRGLTCNLLFSTIFYAKYHFQFGKNINGPYIPNKIHFQLCFLFKWNSWNNVLQFLTTILPHPIAFLVIPSLLIHPQWIYMYTQFCLSKKQNQGIYQY